MRGVLARVLGHLLPPDLPFPELLSFDEFCILRFFSLMFCLPLNDHLHLVSGSEVVKHLHIILTL